MTYTKLWVSLTPNQHPRVTVTLTKHPLRADVIYTCSSLSGNDSSLLDGLVPLNSSAAAAVAGMSSLDYSTVEEFHRVGEGYVLAAIVLFGVSANVFSIIVMR